MKNEFDNKLTDKGWLSMRRLLDREMPERRRRRFVWWPLALLLLSLAGASSWWLWRQSKTVPVVSPPTEAPKVSEPVVNAENQREPGFPAVVGVPANNKRRSSIFGKEQQPLVQPLTRSVVGVPANNGKENVSGRNPIFREEALGENTKRGGEQVPANPSIEPDKVVASPLNLVYPPEAAEISEASNSTDLSQNTVKIETLEPLPARSPDIAGIVTSSESSATSGTIIKKKNDVRWSFGLAAGLASDNFSSLNGFSAGGAVDWRFAGKWGLRSGLQYAQYRLSTDEQPVVSLAAVDYADATGNLVLNSGTSYPSPSQDLDSVSVFVPVERLRQLEMPLLAYWQPLRALRIYGGISVAYNLSAQASEQNYSGNQYYYAKTQDAKDNLNKLAVSNIQRWQTNLQTGLGLHLGKHFELGAFYKYGLSDLKNGADPGSFDASFTGGGATESTGQKGATHYFLLNGIWFF